MTKLHCKSIPFFFFFRTICLESNIEMSEEFFYTNYHIILLTSVMSHTFVCLSCFHRNIQILKEQLSGLWEQENRLTLVPGYTGNIAKVKYSS